MWRNHVATWVHQIQIHQKTTIPQVLYPNPCSSLMLSAIIWRFYAVYRNRSCVACSTVWCTELVTPFKSMYCDMWFQNLGKTQCSIAAHQHPPPTSGSQSSVQPNLCARNATLHAKAVESEVPSSDSDSDSWKFRLSDYDSNPQSGPTPTSSCISYLKWYYFQMNS